MPGTLLSRLPESNRLERIWKLASVDFKKRYYNDKLGLVWALLNPLLRIGVYYFFFVKILKIDIENYALFLFSGLLLWMAFSESTKNGMKIFTTKKYLIEHIQLKKMDLFAANTLGAFMGLCFNFLAYFIFSIALGVWIGRTVLYLPVILITLFILCTAVSILLAVLQIHLKDINHLWDILLLGGFWTSGVFFDIASIQESYSFAIYLHPFLGIIDNTRNILMCQSPPDFGILLYNLLFAIGLFIISLFLLNKNGHLALEKQ